MLRAAAVFSDHMVLQRERPVVVFGEADAPVTATIDVVRAEAIPFEGRFRLTLPPLKGNGFGAHHVDRGRHGGVRLAEHDHRALALQHHVI